MVPCTWAHLGSCDSLQLGEGGQPESLVTAPSFPTGFFKLKTAGGRFLSVSFFSLLYGLPYPQPKPAALRIIKQRNLGSAASKLVSQVLQKDVGIWWHRIWAAWKCWHFIVNCLKVLLWPKRVEGMHHTCRTRNRPKLFLLRYKMSTNHLHCDWWWGGVTWFLLSYKVDVFIFLCLRPYIISTALLKPPSLFRRVFQE